MPEENVLFARETDAPAVSEDTSGEVQASKYLICISDGLLYGVDAEQVETIITDHSIVAPFSLRCYPAQNIPWPAL